MTPDDYEVRYREALADLKQRGKKVGYPYETHDRVRTVRVDGFPCSDEVVFAVAWGKETARDIMTQHRSFPG
jgi:hypothetical protein